MRYGTSNFSFVPARTHYVGVPSVNSGFFNWRDETQSTIFRDTFGLGDGLTGRDFFWHFTMFFLLHFLSQYPSFVCRAFVPPPLLNYHSPSNLCILNNRTIPHDISPSISPHKDCRRRQLLCLHLYTTHTPSKPFISPAPSPHIQTLKQSRRVLHSYPSPSFPPFQPTTSPPLPPFPSPLGPPPVAAHIHPTIPSQSTRTDKHASKAKRQSAHFSPPSFPATNLPKAKITENPLSLKLWRFRSFVKYSVVQAKFYAFPHCNAAPRAKAKARRKGWTLGREGNESEQPTLGGGFSCYFIAGHAMDVGFLFV